MATGNFLLDKLLAAYGDNFDNVLDSTERNSGIVTIYGNTTDVSQIDPMKMYKSSYKQEAIRPALSKSGTCELCLRSNGRIFMGRDIALPNGKAGHHYGCVCVFELVDTPVKNGQYVGKDLGSRKRITMNSNALNNTSYRDMQILAKKRGVNAGGKTEDLRKTLLKSYIK